MARNIEAIVDRQIQRWNQETQTLREKPPGTVAAGPVITVSRNFGSGGGEVARLVAERLNCQLYERSLVEEIAKRSEVRRELVEAVDEHLKSRVESWVEGLLRHKMFDEGDFFHHLVEVLRLLAEMGSVVIVGRGANFILRHRRGLDVRIVASFDTRTARIMERKNLGRQEAESLIHKNDSERGKFIHQLYGRNWEDPCAYDLVINTDRVSLSCAAGIVEQAWLQHAAARGEPLSEKEEAKSL